MPEMLMILAIALIVIGPKKLPDLARSMGRALGEFRRATSDIKESIERETGLGDVKQSLDELGKDIKETVETGSDLVDAVPQEGESQSGPEDKLGKVQEAFSQMNQADDKDQSTDSDPEGKRGTQVAEHDKPDISES